MLAEADREIQFRGLSPDQREHLMLRAAKGYYDLEMTMADLARELGLTRFQVSRLLKDARETGIVRIEIVPRTPRRPDLEAGLQRRFGLKDAVVVPNAIDDAMTLDAVAQAAGRFIAGLAPQSLIGVSWGRTMAAVAHRLPPFWASGIEVVLLNGAMNIRSSASRTNNVAELFAQAGAGAATLLPVPAIVGKAATRDALEQDPTIADVLALGVAAKTVIFGIGSVEPGSVLVQSGFITERDLATLRRKGAVGDVLGRFIDPHGVIVDPALDARTIGLAPAACRDKPYAIAVAAGASKHAAVRAALRAGYMNVLVTDEGTAAFLLGET
ncbi:sugar-binding transcriptional regulator [Lichenifustis flavocetrariae]|uniref:Sugar-binding transcriptional regulator n=1 Tax=Lichenifustis flavocetrariae TaxID=2949735 RepID=A0AA41YUM8_9HYPH|nr:sugar-binding transcriptional regulator [Lichenifustis flavocetrariae]MCW6508879.1 sugar-binding transcriptional regulator [Lichenifustis flavocetrariae]